jgi:hypothetical protein
MQSASLAGAHSGVSERATAWNTELPFVALLFLTCNDRLKSNFILGGRHFYHPQADRRKIAKEFGISRSSRKECTHVQL